MTPKELRVACVASFIAINIKYMRKVHDYANRVIYNYKLSDKDNLINIAEHLSELKRHVRNDKVDRIETKILFEYLKLNWWEFKKKKEFKKHLRENFNDNYLLGILIR